MTAQGCGLYRQALSVSLSDSAGGQFNWLDQKFTSNVGKETGCCAQLDVQNNTISIPKLAFYIIMRNA